MAKNNIREAYLHLQVALVTSLPSDDQMIVEHMRSAHSLLQAELSSEPEVNRMSEVTNLELWKQAIAQLEVAEESLDQAHSTMKDINCEGIVATTFGSPNVKMLVAGAESLITELKETECDECNHPVSKHGDRYGCTHERGDRDGVAQGPCSCDWGQRSSTLMKIVQQKEKRRKCF